MSLIFYWDMFTQALYDYTDIGVYMTLIRLLILQSCNKINLGYASSREPQEFMTIVN